jgi:hypothetical protein
MTSSPNTNSGTRYFYTDPLAAAWMAKHFGMRFRNMNNGAEITIQHIIQHATTGNVCNICIHPDSLHLLEPLPAPNGIMAKSIIASTAPTFSSSSGRRTPSTGRKARQCDGYELECRASTRH